MKRAKLLILAAGAAAILLPAISGTAAAQSMDDLFDDPEQGIVGDEQSDADGDGAGDGAQEGEGGDGVSVPGSGEGASEGTSGGAAGGGSGGAGEGGVDISSLTTSPPQFSGSVNANAGLSLGFEEWPGSEAAGERSAAELLRGSGLYDMSATLKVDARPHPQIRFQASFNSELDENKMSFTSPSIGELFVDYTLGQNLFIRAGKQGLTWGEARLLGNPANLVNRLSNGVAIRASYPVGPGSLTGAVYSIWSWVEENRPGSWRSFGYAALYETTVAGVTGQLSGHFKTDELTRTAASLSFGLGPVDVTAEGMARWDYEDIPGGVQEWGALGQAYWEYEGWSLLGEYEFDSAVADYKGHYIGVGVGAPDIFGGWSPRVRWRHAVQDNSGEIAPGLSGTVAPRLTATIGTPIVYGEPGSFYREADEGSSSAGQPIPGDDVISVLLGVELSFSF